MWNGGAFLMPVFQILQSSFKVTYHDRKTVVSSKVGTMHISWGENLIFHHFPKYHNPCDIMKHCVIFLIESLLKMMKNAFLFYPESFFHAEDI